MKYLFSFFLLLLLPNMVSAQDSKGGVGLVGSFDFYRYDFKPAPEAGAEYEHIFNYSIGLMGSYQFTDMFSGRLGLLGSKKGFRKTFMESPADSLSLNPITETTLDIYYLDIPVLFDYDFPLRPNLRLFVSAGIVPGIRITEKELSTFGDESRKQTNTMQDNLKGMIWSGSLSAGLKYVVHNNKSIRIEPYYRPYFSNPDGAVISGNPSAFGILIGIFQHF